MSVRVALEIYQCTLLAEFFSQYSVSSLCHVEEEHIRREVHRVHQCLYFPVLRREILPTRTCRHARPGLACSRALMSHSRIALIIQFVHTAQDGGTTLECVIHKSHISSIGLHVTFHLITLR